MNFATPSGEAVWRSAAWLAEATEWIDACLLAAGRTRTGDPEVWRVVRWSALLRVETDRGTVWMKAPRPECAIEIDLYGLFERVAPGHVTPPLAVDAERAWLLLADAGTPLAGEEDPDTVLDVFEAVLPRYAALQRAVAPCAPEMLAAGMADLRPATLGEVLEEVCAVALADLERSGDPEDVAHIVHGARALHGEVEAWAAQLAAAAPPPTIEHGDLTLNNVLVDGPRAALIDWGDAVVGHPFAGLRVLLGSVAAKLHGASAGDPRLVRLRDAYLEPWTDLASLGELRTIAELAVGIAPIHRAVAIQRAVRSQPGEGPPSPRWASFTARELADLGG